MFINEELQLFITGSVFWSNKAHFLASCLYLSYSTHTIIEKSVFNNNSAINSGVFALTMGAHIQVLNSEFSYNQADRNSAIAIIFTIESVRLS